MLGHKPATKPPVVLLDTLEDAPEPNELDNDVEVEDKDNILPMDNSFSLTNNTTATKAILSKFIASQAVLQAIWYRYGPCFLYFNHVHNAIVFWY